MFTPAAGMVPSAPSSRHGILQRGTNIMDGVPGVTQASECNARLRGPPITAADPVKPRCRQRGVKPSQAASGALGSRPLLRPRSPLVAFRAGGPQALLHPDLQLYCLHAWHLLVSLTLQVRRGEGQAEAHFCGIQAAAPAWAVATAAAAAAAAGGGQGYRLASCAEKCAAMSQKDHG